MTGEYEYSSAYPVADQGLTKLTVPSSLSRNSTKDCASLKYVSADAKLVLEEADCWYDDRTGVLLTVIDGQRVGHGV